MILIAALFVLDFLLLWVLALTRRAWWAPVICATILVVFLNWFVINAFNDGAGWPKKGISQTTTYQFLACDVVPPSGNEQGAIYLLLVPPSQNPKIGYNSAFESPRLFSVPFSNQLAEQCQKAEKQGEQGIQEYVKAPKAKGKKTGNPNNLRKMRLHFYKNPAGGFPSKP